MPSTCQKHESLRGEPVAPGGLFLEPVDMVVDHELADRDGAGDGSEDQRQQEVDERRERHVDRRVHQAARMAVDALVQILIRSLEIEIGHRVLHHEHRQ